MNYREESKRLAKAWLLSNPVLARIFAEYKRRYGRIWLDDEGVQSTVQGVPPVPRGETSVKS